LTVSRYDGETAAALADRWQLPSVSIHEAVPSTMDAAHALASAGAMAGTVVLADEQTAGRGRSGGRWSAPPRSAVLVTIIERPQQPAAVELLSIRVGLALAMALAPLSRSALGLKWPNDLFDQHGKLGGTLCEARWRGARLDWVAIGVGINVSAAPADTGARVSALQDGVTRLEVLDAVIPALRRAAAIEAETLDSAELEAWRIRDVLVGRSILSPAVGRVSGVSASGALVVASAAGEVACRVGHIILAEA
jgi:BirA family transcriptional regulator, biotin operon repressor / biotin---[acetyl-CoA-carboxylase] ligase